MSVVPPTKPLVITPIYAVESSNSTTVEPELVCQSLSDSASTCVPAQAHILLTNSCSQKSCDFVCR